MTLSWLRALNLRQCSQEEVIATCRQPASQRKNLTDGTVSTMQQAWDIGTTRRKIISHEHGSCAADLQGEHSRLYLINQRLHEEYLYWAQ